MDDITKLKLLGRDCQQMEGESDEDDDDDDNSGGNSSTRRVNIRARIDIDW